MRFSSICLCCVFFLLPISIAASQEVAPPLPSPLEQNAETKRQQQIDEREQFHAFLARCGELRAKSLEHVNLIAVVEYTGEYKEWRIASPNSGGKAVDFFFKPIQILEGMEDKKILITQLLVNAEIQEMSKEEFINTLYVPQQRYLLLAQRISLNAQKKEYDSDGNPYYRSISHHPIEIIPLNNKNE